MLHYLCLDNMKLSQMTSKVQLAEKLQFPLSSSAHQEKKIKSHIIILQVVSQRHSDED